MKNHIIRGLEIMIGEVENRPTGFPLQPTILKIILDLYKSGKNEIVAREISKKLKDSGTRYPSICGTMVKITKRGLANLAGNNKADLKLIFKRRILITGGAGFIGSNLCEEFLSKGDEVICLDNFSTGFRHNIDAFLNNPNFKLIEGDIRSLETCRESVKM